jgi:hypothetical protein
MGFPQYLVFRIHDDVFEEPIEGRLDPRLLVLLLADGQNPGIVEEELAPLPVSFMVRGTLNR